MRLFAFICLISGPAAAWEYSPLPICTLSHIGAGLEVAVTYDPGRAQPYAISLTSPDPWPVAPVFGIRFSGGREQTITTPTHEVSNNGRTLTVRDQGFGNVLNGLQFNTTATAFTGATAHQVSLDGAAEPLQDFRDCLVQPSV